MGRLGEIVMRPSFHRWCHVEPSRAGSNSLRVETRGESLQRAFLGTGVANRDSPLASRCISLPTRAATLRRTQ